jgi:hypothetical protein
MNLLLCFDLNLKNSKLLFHIIPTPKTSVTLLDTTGTRGLTRFCGWWVCIRQTLPCLMDLPWAFPKGVRTHQHQNINNIVLISTQTTLFLVTSTRQNTRIFHDFP